MAIATSGHFEFDSDFVQPFAWWLVQTIDSIGQAPTQNAPLSRQVRGALPASDYLHTLRNLLPYGPAWTDDPETAVGRLFDGLSQELARIDARCWALIDEADPRDTQELFPEWLAEFGLPDRCVAALGVTPTNAQLRSALLGRIVSIGGAQSTYFMSVALTLGFAITITEYLGTDRPYQWQVNVSIADSLTRFSFASTFSMPLASWGSALLECVLKRLAPAHTQLVFSYF